MELEAGCGISHPSIASFDLLLKQERLERYFLLLETASITILLLPFWFLRSFLLCFYNRNAVFVANRIGNEQLHFFSVLTTVWVSESSSLFGLELIHFFFFFPQCQFQSSERDPHLTTTILLPRARVASYYCHIASVLMAPKERRRKLWATSSCPSWIERPFGRRKSLFVLTSAKNIHLDPAGGSE